MGENRFLRTLGTSRQELGVLDEFWRGFDKSLNDECQMVR
jgi:hypothetical protein